MAYLVVDGTTITEDVVESVRGDIIRVRNRFLEGGQMEWALTYTYIVAMLGDYAKRIEEENK